MTWIKTVRMDEDDRVDGPVGKEVAEGGDEGVQRGEQKRWQRVVGGQSNEEGQDQEDGGRREESGGEAAGKGGG